MPQRRSSSPDQTPQQPAWRGRAAAWLRRANHLLDTPRGLALALALILLLAGWLRLSGQNWDENRHLHPDERFLSSVTNDLRWPSEWKNYFDPNTSTLSPYTNPEMGLFVYGTLPVTVVKWTAVRLGLDNYDSITRVGRALSALCDLAAIVVLFWIGRRLYGARVGLLAALLLALSVLNIQLAHFYAVDTFANLFLLATFLFLLRASASGRWLDYAAAGLLFGLALASKVSTMTVIVAVLLALALDFTRKAKENGPRAALEHGLVRLATLLLVAALVFRVAQPIAFRGPGFLDMSFNPDWLDDIREQGRIAAGDSDLPWLQQWTGRSALFPLQNILLWGLGLPLGLAALAGLALAGMQLAAAALRWGWPAADPGGWRERLARLAQDGDFPRQHLLPVAFVLSAFLYHALTFVKFMRYFFPLYPFLALLAAYLLAWLWRRATALQTVQAQPQKPQESIPVLVEDMPPAPALVDAPPPAQEPAPSAAWIETPTPAETILPNTAAPSSPPRRNAEILYERVLGWLGGKPRSPQPAPIRPPAPTGEPTAPPPAPRQTPAPPVPPPVPQRPPTAPRQAARPLRSRPFALRRITPRLTPALALALGAVVVFGTLAYALAFHSIYTRPHPRLAATRWIYQNVPPGAALAVEHWDDWLPIGGVDGYTAFGDDGIYTAVEMRNYDDDNPAKLDNLIAALDEADYIILSSNRLYDSIPRLPRRYPLTSRYYDLLFAGQLGFAPLAEFSSYPSLLGLAIPDQFAEESFHVYDHPRVQIFQKTTGFDPIAARALLQQGVDWESVVHLTPFQASAAPTALQFTPLERERYRRAALTSSRAISPESWGSRAPILAWFLALQALALLALPITLAGLGRLADRGYILSKLIGLLLVSWAAWLFASLRLAAFSRGQILFVAADLAMLSFLALTWQWQSIRDFFRQHWRLALLEEVLFWAFFAGLVFIRMHNPDLWHPDLGGEKPMDLAYLTAVTRTPFFPPYDPWFSGGYINYYYFGFVLIASLIHLTGIPPVTAYNLAVPTLFAMTALGGFSAALNLAHGLRGRGTAFDSRRARRAVALAGLCGALFVAVIGNLGQVRVIANGLRDLSERPAAESATWQDSAARLLDGAQIWLAERPAIEMPVEWWYWNATRIIPPGEGEPGPINEMPFFTFLFGDLHAHMLALPLTLLALALALNLVRDPLDSPPDLPWYADPPEVLGLGLLALVSGALWPTNTWDFPTYTLLAGAALLLREMARRGRLDLPALWAAGWRFALVLAAGRMLFLPYHAAYAGSYMSAALWHGSRTGLQPYLLIHGFFLFVLAAFLLDDLLHGTGHNAVVQSLQNRLRRRPAPASAQGEPYGLLRDAAWIALAAALLALVIQPAVGLALLLALLAALLLLRARPDPQRQFALCLILLGLLLTAVVEVVVLKGDVGRMNTVFKFYLQVWVLWAVAAAAALPGLAQALAGTPMPAPAEAAPIQPTRRPLRLRAFGSVWWLAFGLLLAACLLYPITAAPARIRDRFAGSTAITLDGSAFQRSAIYRDQEHDIALDWDRQAAEWLRANTRGIPTILEANTPIYRWGSRVSIYTGLPTVIGWDWHQKQQRALLPGALVDQRVEDVRAIYITRDPALAQMLLARYGVEYIYVGALERLYYGENGLAKFDQPTGWELVYQNEQVRIYRVE